MIYFFCWNPQKKKKTRTRISKEKHVLLIFIFLFKINIFLVFLDYFDALISKIIFLKIKNYYFDIFPSKKYFEK